MNNKSFFKQCICAIIFLSIFSGCASNSNQEQKMEECIEVQKMKECIVLAHTEVSKIKGGGTDMSTNMYDIFTSEEIFRTVLFRFRDGARLDSITYIGHNWFKVSYEYWYNSGVGIDYERRLGLSYLQIKKEGDKFKLNNVASAYSQCRTYIEDEDLPNADRIKFWFNSLKYEAVQSYFQGNLRKVVNDNKYGFINIDGIEILPCQYDDIAFVMGGIGDLIEIDKNKIVLHDDCCDSLLYVKLDDKYGLINFDGKEIAPCRYDDLTLFPEGKYWAGNRFFKTKLDDKYGLINFDGKEIIPCKYSDLIEYGGPINGAIKSKSNNKYGLITYEGKEILPCIFDELIMDDCWGMLKVQKDNLWSYYTIDGTQETEFYEDIKYYYELDNPIFAAKSNGKWGYINKAGDTIVSFILDYAGKAYNDGTAFVTYEGQSGTLDLNTLFFSPSYDYNAGNSVTGQTCAVCGGTGQMSVRGGGIVLGTQQCPACGGLGYHVVPSYY